MKKSGSTHKTALQTAKLPSISPNKTQVASELTGTFWRVACPVAAGVAIGELFDDILGASPWLKLVGAVAGFIIASWLVRRQTGYGDVLPAQHRTKEHQSN